MQTENVMCCIFLTFSKEGQSQHQPVQRQRSGLCGVDDQRHRPRQAEEQVHGGVLPVHQIVPVFLCRVVQMERRTVRRILLHQNAYGAQQDENSLLKAPYCVKLILQLFTKSECFSRGP